MLWALGLLFISNIFMNYAWYGHLKTLSDKPIWIAIGVSWLVALLEYAFQVPANRIGARYFSLAQLKISQEVITLIVFSIFSIFYMKQPLTRNYIYASLCLGGAVFFIFKDRMPHG